MTVLLGMVWFFKEFFMRNYYFLSGALNFYLVCNIGQVAEKQDNVNPM